MFCADRNNTGWRKSLVICGRGSCRRATSWSRLGENSLVHKFRVTLKRVTRSASTARRRQAVWPEGQEVIESQWIDCFPFPVQILAGNEADGERERKRTSERTTRSSSLSLGSSAMYQPNEGQNYLPKKKVVSALNMYTLRSWYYLLNNSA